MDTDRWLRVKEIFLEAIRRNPEERRAFLETCCENDPELRKEVDALLSSHEDSDAFMELPTQAALFPDERADHPVLKRVGPYIIRKVISVGGMGTVYEALQESPRRKVAIKVMTEGVASRSALRRFEYESQVLASLRHPNIAQVIEAGTHYPEGAGYSAEACFSKEGDQRKETGYSEDAGYSKDTNSSKDVDYPNDVRTRQGLPYFVMEFIPDARSITDFAWEKGLSISDRLRLFLPVCDAVQHGHQKGVIHRDLKPSNLLVDPGGNVRIIDFGVARATDSDLSLTTAQTDVGQLIGTVQYMSPEQCTADPNELDTRSDVYALGVVLYELLCEELPYDVRKAVVFEATRVIREAPPKKPSTTKRSLKGDAETIVLKALEKEKTRRYQSVADLGADIQRYLNGEVILAKPAGPATKTWKMVKRNPVLSTAFGVALLMAIAFMGYILFVSYPQLQHERNVAELEKVKALEAKAMMEKEAANTTAIGEFITEMLGSTDPFKVGGEIKIVELLDRASNRIDREFPDRPEIEAPLRKTLGSSYLQLGFYEAAEKQLKDSVRIYNDLLGAEDPMTLRTRVTLSVALMRQERYSEAESLIRSTYEIENRVLGESNEHTLKAMTVLGGVFYKQGNVDEAESLLQKALKGQERLFGLEHSDTLSTKGSIGLVYLYKGKYDQAETLLREVAELQSHLQGEEHPKTLMTKGNLAESLKLQGRYSESESLFTELIEPCQRVLGEEHPVYLSMLSMLGGLEIKQGKYPEAESRLRKVIEVKSRIQGESHRETLGSKSKLAKVLSYQGKAGESIALFREVLKAYSETLGEDHQSTLSNMGNLGICLMKAGQLSDAEALFQKMYEIQLRTMGNEHPNTIHVMSNLAQVKYKRKHYAESEVICREILNYRKRKKGDSHPDTIRTTYRLANTLEAQEKLQEAVAFYQEATEMYRKVDKPETINKGHYYALYGKCLTRLSEFDDAEALLLEAYEVSRIAKGEEDETTASAVLGLIDLYEKWGKPDEVVKWKAKPH